MPSGKAGVNCTQILLLSSLQDEISDCFVPGRQIFVFTPSNSSVETQIIGMLTPTITIPQNVSQPEVDAARNPLNFPLTGILRSDYGWFRMGSYTFLLLDKLHTFKLLITGSPTWLVFLGSSTQCYKTLARRTMFFSEQCARSEIFGAVQSRT